MGTWHTPDTVRAEWPDSVQIPDDLLDQLVVVSQDAVTAYAPALPVFEPTPEEPEQSIPDRYRVAQLIQVKNVWNASMASASGNLGGDTFEIQPRPLDWHVKALLRPARGRPRVG